MTTKISSYVIQASLLNQIANIIPRVTSIGYVGDDTATDTAGGQLVTVQGSGFQNGAVVYVDTTAAGAVTVANSSFLSFTAPAKNSGSYILYVTNPDGGSAIYAPGVQYSGVPIWVTPAGSQGVVYETVPYTNVLNASGDPSTYSLVSGSFPPGATFNGTTGILTGTAPVESGSTTYSFTIRATDAQNQSTDRTFSLTINTDVVTWNSPAAESVYTLDQFIPMSNVTLSATDAAGYAVAYTANSLPTGLTINSGLVTGTPTVVANTSTLLTATAATTARSSTQVISWVVRLTGDAFFPYTTMGLSANVATNALANSFATDSSINNAQITVFGDTKAQNNNPYQEGYYSTYHATSSDFISLAASPVFSIPTNTTPFTVEAWIYLTTTGVQHYVFGEQWTGSGTINMSVGFNAGPGQSLDSAGLYPVFGYYNGTSWSTTAQSTTTVTPNTWNHIAWVFAGSTAYVFINGVNTTASGAATTWGGALTSNGDAWYIGRRWDTGSANGDTLRGYISNLRFVKGTALYTANFVPGTSSLTSITNTQLLACQSNRFVDNSPNNLTLTKNGSVLLTAFNPFGNTAPTGVTVPVSTSYSMYFDGTGDYLSTPNNSAYRFGTGDFTVEWWWYLNSAFSSANGPGFGQKLGDSNGGWVIYRNGSVNTDKISIRLAGQAGAGNADYATTIVPTQNTWQHWAVVRSGTTLTWYCNGVSCGTYTGVSTNVTDTNVAAPMYIGYAQTWSYAIHNSYVSNFRVVTGQAAYTANFIPSTSSLTSVAPVGTVAYSTQFDGTGDQLTVASPNQLTNFGTGDFTVEFWVYLNAVPAGNQGVFTNASTFYINFRSSGTIGLTDASTVYATTASALTAGSWFHIAVVRSSGSSRIYTNGTSGTAVACTVNWTNTGIAYIGGDSGGTINGYISNLRVTVAQALYTSTFTPSTTPLTTTSQGATAANVLILTSQSAGFVDNSVSAQTITRVGDATPSIFNPFYANATVYTSLLACQNSTIVDNGILATPLVVTGDARPSRATPFVGAVTTQALTGYEGSAYFDGTGDYLTLTSTGLGTGNFTIELWGYFTSYPASQNSLFSVGTSDTLSACLLWISNTGTVQLYNSTSPVGTSTTAVPLATWGHIAVVRVGTTITYYINGVASGTGTLSSNLSDTTMQIMRGYGGIVNSAIGYISNLRINKGTALYTSAFFPSFAPLTAVTNTQLLTLQTRGAHNNSAFVDNSTLGNLVTRVGNVSNGTFSPYGDTWSAYFDGNGDYLQLPYTTNFNCPTSFTIEFWAYPISRVTTYPAVLTNYSTYAANGLIGIFCGHASTSTKWSVAFNGVDGVLVSTSNIVYNSWVHIAIVRNGTAMAMYVNGVSESTSTQSATLAGTANSIWIGAAGDNLGITYYNGYVSNLRFVKGQALYTGTFTPSTTPLTTTSQGATASNVSLLTCRDNRFIDIGVSNSTITRNGDASIQKFSPFATFATATRYYSGSFNGSGDYVSVPWSLALTFGAGDFTVEGWFYTTLSTFTSNQIGFGIWDGSSTNPQSWYLQFNTSRQPMFLIDVATTDTTIFTSSVALSPTTWTHVAVTRSGNTWYMFMDGAVVATTTNSSSMSIGSAPLYIGSYQNKVAGDATWNGYISNVRIVKGIALYTGAFTPATAPLALTQSSGTNIAALTGIPTNGNSVYFDGSSYLVVPASHVLGFGTGDFTVECWIYATANPANGVGTIAEFRTGATATATILRVNASYQLVVYNGPSNVETAFTTRTVALNAWYHIAYVRSAGVAYGYINGVLAGSVAIAGDLGTSQPVYIGANQTAGYNFNGYISNFRVVKGLAIYSGTFVPTTSPLALTQSAASNTAALSFSANGNSVYFNGSSSIIATPSAAISFGTGDFTIELWVYASVAPSASWNTIFTLGTGSAGQEIRISQNINGTGYGYLIPDNANSGNVYAGFGTLTLHTWHHIALTRSGSVVYFLRNGTVIGTTTGVSFNHTNTSTMRIGIPQAAYSTDGNLTGYISNLRIIKGTALYAGAYTPPPAPLTVVSGTGLLTCQGSTITDAALNFPLTVSAAVVSPTQGPFGYSPSLLTCQPPYTTLITDNSLAVNPMSIVGTARASRSQSPFGYSPSLLALQNSTFTDNSLDLLVITPSTVTAPVKPVAISPFAVPAVSLVTQAYSPLTHGGSMYFDGTGDYLTLPLNSAATSLGYADFTIEMWIYPTTYSGANQVIISGQSDLASAAGSGFGMYISAATTTDCYAGSTAVSVTSPNPVKNQWSHIALVRYGQTLKTYLNGVQVGYNTFASATTAVNNGATTYAASIGAFSNNTVLFAGYMSDVRIVKGTALYTSNFFPGTAPAAPAGTVPGTFTTYNSALLVNGSTGSVIDTTRSVDLETVGDAKITQFSPYNDVYYSNYFDGSGDLLTFTATSTFAFGTGNFTVECWVYPTAYGGSVVGPQLFGTTNGSATGYSINLGQDVNSFRIISNASGGWADNLTVAAGGGPSLNVWTHIAVVRSGANLTIYKNGMSVATTASAAAWNFSGTNGVVGRFNDGTYTRDLTGYISNLRVVNSALYSTNFIPGTTPLTAVSGTQLLTCQSRTFIDNSTNALAITRTGDVAVRTQNPFQLNTGVSYYFDGTGDYLASPASALYDFGTGDFTIEFWMNASAAGTYTPVAGTQSIAGSATAGMWRVSNRLNSANGIYFNYTTGSAFTDVTFTTTNYNDNSWHYVAITRSSNVLRAFVDGVKVGSDVAITQSLSSGQRLYVGFQAQDSIYYTGYITDLRITRGYARYTTTFTLPTTPLLYK